MTEAAGQEEGEETAAPSTSTSQGSCKYEHEIVAVLLCSEGDDARAEGCPCCL